MCAITVLFFCRLMSTCVMSIADFSILYILILVGARKAFLIRIYAVQRIDK